MPFKCHFCVSDHEFPTINDLSQHILLVHEFNKQIPDQQTFSNGAIGGLDEHHYKCLEGCPISFKFNRDLRKHLLDRHSIEIEELHLEFPNENALEKWIHEEETANCIQCVYPASQKKRRKGIETVYYQCQRLGRLPVLQDEVRKRKSGRCNLDGGCTSQIITNQSLGGSISVKYFKTHYGHVSNTERLKLSKPERTAIASKLMLGYSMEDIIKSIQNSSLSRRLNLLDSKSVTSIKQAFGIKENSDKLSASDSIDVSSLLNEFEVAPFNPVMYSTVNDPEHNSEICFIIMTKQQSTELAENFANAFAISSICFPNYDVEIVILSLIIEDESIPVICALTNKVNVTFLDLFYTKLRDSVGFLRPKILITNSERMYYSSWVKVMGKPGKHLFNAHEMETDWKLNLNRIKSVESRISQEKRTWAYEMLQQLRTMKDENAFVIALEAMMNKFQQDSDFASFLEYFQANYKDLEKWVQLYRVGNKYSEQSCLIMMKTLKGYFEDLSSYRIDKVFHSLLRFVRDESLKCIMKETAASDIISEIDARHMDLEGKHFSARKCSERIFYVTDLYLQREYLVQQHLEPQNICCTLTCSYCRICTHMFSCLCADFFLNNSMCIHIHYIWMIYFQPTIEDEIENVEYDSISTENHQFQGVPVETEDEIDITQLISEKITILSKNLVNVRDPDKLLIVLNSMTQLCELTTPDERIVEPTPSRDEFSLSDHCYVVL